MIPEATGHRLTRRVHLHIPTELAGPFLCQLARLCTDEGGGTLLDQWETLGEAVHDCDADKYELADRWGMAPDAADDEAGNRLGAALDQLLAGLPDYIVADLDAGDARSFGAQIVAEADRAAGPTVVSMAGFLHDANVSHVESR